MTTIVPTFLKVFVGLRRVAQRAAEGISALDTVEVVEFRSYFKGDEDSSFLGVQSGHVKLRNLRTGKTSTHGACILGPEYLDSVAPPIQPPTELAPLKLTRRPLKAKSKFDPTKLKNPVLRVVVTSDDIDGAARDIERGQERTQCCVVSRALNRAIRARFRRHPELYTTTGYGSFTLRTQEDEILRHAVRLPPAASELITKFDRWTDNRQIVPKMGPSPTEFEVDLRTGFKQ